jgi:hypothetical protein
MTIAAARRNHDVNRTLCSARDALSREDNSANGASATIRRFSATVQRQRAPVAFNPLVWGTPDERRLKRQRTEHPVD